MAKGLLSLLIPGTQEAKAKGHFVCCLICLCLIKERLSTFQSTTTKLEFYLIMESSELDTLDIYTIDKGTFEVVLRGWNDTAVGISVWHFKIVLLII